MSLFEAHTHHTHCAERGLELDGVAMLQTTGACVGRGLNAVLGLLELTDEGFAELVWVPLASLKVQLPLRTCQSTPNALFELRVVCFRLAP